MANMSEPESLPAPTTLPAAGSYTSTVTADEAPVPPSSSVTVTATEYTPGEAYARVAEVALPATAPGDVEPSPQRHSDTCVSTVLGSVRAARSAIVAPPRTAPAGAPVTAPTVG